MKMTSLIIYPPTPIVYPTSSILLCDSRWQDLWMEWIGFVSEYGYSCEKGCNKKSGCFQGEGNRILIYFYVSYKL